MPAHRCLSSIACVRANSRMKSAAFAQPTHFFSPLMTQLVVRRSARHWTFATSDPASASESANAPTNSPRTCLRRYSSRLSAGSMFTPIPCARAITLAELIHARDSSSVIRQYSKVPRPSPS